jgi:hypothetical protein
MDEHRYYRDLPLYDRIKIFNRQMELFESGFASESEHIQKECFNQAVKEYKQNGTIIRKRGRPRKTTL